MASQQQQHMKCCKRFMSRYSRSVDSLSASLIIILCLIVLLPKVHESFNTEETHPDHLPAKSSISPTSLPASSNQIPQSTNTPLGQRKSPILLIDADQPDAKHDDHDHDHLPLGEIFICLGFITFYCVGMSLEPAGTVESSALMGDTTRTSVCCSSTRCPTSIQDEASTSQQELKPAAENKAHLESQEDTCLMLLNRHHNHHVHAHHHDHGKTSYGSIVESGLTKSDRTSRKSMSKTAIMEEDGLDDEVEQSQNLSVCRWPDTVKYTFFSLIMIALLTIFDIKVQGLTTFVKVFRAGATGALLYIAFYLVLPKTSASCKSCSEEVAQ